MSINSTWWGGNNYSTDEQVIGTWIDGRPVYQRVYVLSSPVTLTKGNWTEVSGVVLPDDIDSVIGGGVVTSGGTYMTLHLSYTSSNPTHLFAGALGESVFTYSAKTFIVQYIKKLT